MSKPIRAMRDVFIEKLHAVMRQREDIFFLSADFGSPKLDALREEFPGKFINVGISEQNLINVSAGLAIEGWNVFAYAIAPFITMRCFEQIRVNLALLSLERTMNVTLIGVGAGVSYDVSGPTHHCLEDITLMRLLPGFEVFSPSDYTTAELLADHSLQKNGLRYLRFDSKPLPAIHQSADVNMMKGFVELKRGEKVLLLATGFMVTVSLQLQDQLALAGIKVGVVDIFNLSNPDEKSLTAIISQYSDVVSMEEGIIERGGLDSLLSVIIRKSRLNVSLHPIGIKNEYSFAIGSRNYIHESYGFGIESIKNLIVNIVKK